MTTHLSVRLVWHDRGWDGHVCDAPLLNASCIVHQHIREGRKKTDELERASASRHLSELDGWRPPCSRDPGAYSARGYSVTHDDPLAFRALPSVGENLPAYSICPSPYRWMREENFRTVCDANNLSIRGPNEPKDNGWVMEPDRQRDLLFHFWEKIEPRRSLVFFYCNQGNPVDEDAPRIVVGVGRVAELGPQLYFGTKPKYEELHPVWSRRVTQDYPDHGVRIPYQEYLRAGHPIEGIVCKVPQSALTDFSYVGEHVSDDVAVAVLERIIQSIEQVREDGHIPGAWDKALAWLNDALAEVWSNRGPFPGIGSVLQYLGFDKGTAYQRSVLAPLARNQQNPWEHVLEILEGRREPDEGPYKKGLLAARSRWAKLPSRQTLLSKLVRFELSKEQIDRIASAEQRRKSGINAPEDAIVANPYLLPELDLGDGDSDPIALETIDHGMLPEGDAALFPDGEEVRHDDPRRVRAIAHAVLREAAQSGGDTVLMFPDLLERVANLFTERRACKPDSEVVIADADFHQEMLWTAFDSDPQVVALKALYDLERYATATIKRLAAKAYPRGTDTDDWSRALAKHFPAAKTERERAALAEKAFALETLFTRRLSVLTGGAGTGKTSVLEVFLNELERLEGHNPLLLLAPTGKARVRLATKTKRNSMTIHQFLLKQGWFVPANFALKNASDRAPFKACTVVIDECSMIPADLFGTLLKALDLNIIKRLVLVGDPSQLPPIGPGRPFVDVIDWLKAEMPTCLAPLATCMRTNEDGMVTGEESVALALANGFRNEQSGPADDEILAAVAKGQRQGDLDVIFWDNHENLLAAIKSKVASVLSIKEKDYQAFNQSFGIDAEDWEKSERWQILSPTRAQFFGTEDLNRLIQLEFKGGLLTRAHQRRGNSPRPFGDQELVWTDKVIQITNRVANAWPRGEGLDYIANGEIGIVHGTSKGNNGSDFLDVTFSTQPKSSYRYFRNQVNDNLELAYALTVHKAQGSDFDIVFLIVPQSAGTLSRELIYTGLTRFRKRLILLIERDVAPLLRLRGPDSSDTLMRNTQMFKLALRPDSIARPHLEALIHRTKKGTPVRSKSEVIVGDILDSLGISYEYEKALPSPVDKRDFRLPDFTVAYDGETYYWEHLGMLDVPSYREAWSRKLDWYKANGYFERLITSKDEANGGIDAKRIEGIARERIIEAAPELV